MRNRDQFNPKWVRCIILCCLGIASFIAIRFVIDQKQLVSEMAAAEPAKSKVAPQKLFEDWPQDRKPDLVIVLTGQMHGYLQKCGCSNPQKGGLERRYNFMEALRNRGWEVIGLDVGDILHPLRYSPTMQQTLTKYEFAMQAMKLMGYKATTIGEQELKGPLLDVLQRYSLQKGNEFPRVIATNVANRDDFPGRVNGSSLVDSEIVVSKSGLKLGVVGVAGMEIMKNNPDRTVKFEMQTKAAVDKVLTDWNQKKETPDLKVLLYQGPFEYTDPVTKVKADAQTASKALPEFQVVVCKTEDSEPPSRPDIVNHGGTQSIICRVGQKGQNVGVLGIFKGAKGTEFYYQRVVMAEEFDTDPANEKGHPILKLLQDYSDTVKSNDFMSEMANRKRPHQIQTLAGGKNAAYSGDTICQTCHQAEFGVWMKSKHSGAYHALSTIATKPTGRNFDGECIVCHTVGYEYKTGYINESKTAHLKNVQCESCHGPASLHVAEELDNLKNKKNSHAMGLMLSPWKIDGKGNLPAMEKIEEMALAPDSDKRQAIVKPMEYQIYLRVYQTCIGCHDIDNDPHFKDDSFAKYWKQVSHSGLSKKK